MRLPSNNRVTLPYGSTLSPWYSSSNPHAGTDYSYFPNPYIYAPEKIKVTRTGYLGTAGESIDAQSIDGSRKYRFCHLATYNNISNKVYPEGHRLGHMGSTGQADGAHLHFVMWVNGRRVDGDKLIRKAIMAEELENCKKKRDSLRKERDIMRKSRDKALKGLAASEKKAQKLAKKLAECKKNERPAKARTWLEKFNNWIRGK